MSFFADESEQWPPYGHQYRLGQAISLTAVEQAVGHLVPV